MSTDVDELLPEEAKVFLSYSRKDRERAQAVADVLRSRHFGVFKDTDDILPTEEWRERLSELIESADTIVFLLSPHSAVSEVCAWEVEYAHSLNKRIAPIVIDDVASDAIPPLLTRLNFIFCTPRDPFENAIDTLVSALNTDIEWVREHTRIAGLARRWNTAGRPARLLLRGQDITDSEAWRDSKPIEAPDLEQLQAGFIAESRRASGRRQRNWVIGSLGMTAAMAALAIFAYFQSVEATRQRTIAEEQRGVAEEQRAEAEQQRGVAEEQRAKAELQRVAALKTLAGDRLRAGAPAAALSALDQSRAGAAPDARMHALVAGLKKRDEVAGQATPGRAFILNGELGISKGPHQPQAHVPGFPAKYGVALKDASLLVAQVGGMRLYDLDGKLIQEVESNADIKPCFLDRGKADRVDVWGLRISGYSACSGTMYRWQISNGVISVPEEFHFCGGAPVTFAANPETEHQAAGFGGMCFGAPASAKAINEALPGVAGIAPLEPLPAYTFPASRDEASLWSAAQDYGPDRLEALTAAHVRGLPLPKKYLEGMAVIQSQETAQFYMLPDIIRTKHLEIVENLSIWGGTGGEVHNLCWVATGRPAECVGLHTLTGFNGIRAAAARPAFAFFGTSLTPDSATVSDLDEEPHSFYFVDGARVTPVTSVAKFGQVLDADFSSDDSRIAVLSESGLVLLEAGGNFATEIVVAPPKAAAVEWLFDGTLVVLSDDGQLHFRDGQRGFVRVELADGFASTPEAEDQGGSPRHWLSENPDDGVLAIGYGDRVQVFDTRLRGPITGVVSIGDRQMQRSSNTEPIPYLRENGAVGLKYNLRTYERRGVDTGVNPADYY